MGGGLSCALQVAYTPDQSNGFQNTPCLVFKVNYHFLRPTNGSGPYAGDMSTYVNTEMVSLNGYYNELLAPALPVTPPAEHIVDSRIRFELTGIYYHDDDVRYDHYFNLDDHPNCLPTLRDEFGVDQDNVINIFFYRFVDAGKKYGCGPSAYMTVNMINIMPSFDSGLLAHELGHVVGSFHTYYDGCTFCGEYDGLSDTYFPDCSINTEGCGPDVLWTNTDPDCPMTGIGISNNIMGSNSCRRYLSPMQLAKIQRSNITSESKRNYILCQPHLLNPTIVVANSAVWESSKIINADIEIEPGAVLDVRCVLYMSPHARIIVKPGAKLIVDGGTLTAHSGGCNTFWGGIQVWGTSNEHQYPGSNPTYQGLVILKNGAVIEHAREAIRLWKPWDWESMGGIVKVQGTPTQVGATFLNCRRSVEFMKYQNFNPGDPDELHANLSTFGYATFIIDNAYRGGEDFEAHVTMWAVDGIQFRACQFKNSQSTVTSSPRLGEGIGSLDASYTVNGNCTAVLPYGTPCPDEDLDRGLFSGLGHALDARNGGSGRGFTAADLDFHNNVVGTYADGLPGFTVVRNRFVMGERLVDLEGEVDDNFFEEHHRGVSTQKSFGFRIEENEFNPAGNVEALGLDAIVIENSGSNSTEVYNNTASGMTNGYIAEGNCMDPIEASAVGHQFTCNNNVGNEQNFWVRKDNYENQNTGIHSERTQQGANEMSAGNEFDQGTGETDYKNETAWVINYWHHGGTSEPMAITPGWLVKTLANGTNNCPSRLDDREVKLSEGHKQQVQTEFQAAKSAYINTAYVFNSLLDGGNTDAVVQEVEESWPQDAWDLRNYLMSKSPYLSTTVLVEMMIKNILPQAMVLEVCLANPEATKKDGFVKWAEFQAPSPLPTYMIDLIAGSWEARTFRMELEAQIGQHHAAMSVASYMLQASYRAEEVIIPLDAMLAQWNLMPNYGARYAEAQVHLRKGEFEAAMAILDGLADRYPMKEDRVAERDRAIWYIDQLQNLSLDGRSVMQLTSAELVQWQSFAETANDIAGDWAANVLCFGYKICIERTGSGEGGNKSLHPSKPDAAGRTLTALSLAPNPAGSWVTFSHALSAEPSEAQLRVVDARGREVARLSINALQGQTLWDTREVPAGVYSVELFNAGVRVDGERLVVQPTR